MFMLPATPRLGRCLRVSVVCVCVLLALNFVLLYYSRETRQWQRLCSYVGINSTNTQEPVISPSRSEKTDLGDNTEISQTEKKKRFYTATSSAQRVVERLSEIETDKRNSHIDSEAEAVGDDEALGGTASINGDGLNRTCTCHSKRETACVRIRNSTSHANQQQFRASSIVGDPFNYFHSSSAVNHFPECTAFSSGPCFDFSRCLLTRPFLTFVYTNHFKNQFQLKHPNVLEQLLSSLEEKKSLTSNPAEACAFIVLLDHSEEFTSSMDKLEQMLHSLPHWNSGKNHVLIDISEDNHISTLLRTIQTGSAIIADSYVHLTPDYSKRHNSNILIPLLVITDHLLQPLPVFSTKQHLLYFRGQYVSSEMSQKTAVSQTFTETMENLQSLLQDLARTSVVFETHCECMCESTAVCALDGEWALCGNRETRLEEHSQFSLVPGGVGGHMGKTTFLRLMEALERGSVPVILGIAVLPFDEVINWRKAAIILPWVWFREIPRLITELDSHVILQYQKQGRFLFQTFFSSPTHILDSVVSVVRYKTFHPPPTAPDHEAMKLVSSNAVLHAPTHQSSYSIYSEDFWNSPPGPFYAYPSTPFRLTPFHYSGMKNVSGLAEADMFERIRLKSLSDRLAAMASRSEEMRARVQYQLDRVRQRIAGDDDGADVRTVKFNSTLLGNHADERFTILMTVESTGDKLQDTLLYFKHLPFMGKVVVVWNGDPSVWNGDPSVWNEVILPDIGAPIEVVRTADLHSHFLPLSSIQTEAVLFLNGPNLPHSLSQEEIQFAFRIWRDNRDVVVGWEGERVGWSGPSGRWQYSSTKSCEISMINTKAAFLHKYYTYLYTYWMPQQVRDTVNHQPACASVAMNFLVAHIARKPPIAIKHTSPLCEHCTNKESPGTHELDHCLSSLVEAYGYIPLMHTQLGTHSILFSTRGGNTTPPSESPILANNTRSEPDTAQVTPKCFNSV